MIQLMQLMFSDCIVIVRNMLQSLKRLSFTFPLETVSALRGKGERALKGIW